MSIARNAAFAACGLVLVAASPAWADPPPLKTSETFENFGDLNQNSTKCKAADCGPAAAVNGFWFLQKQYPTIFDQRLIPKVSTPPSDRDDMIKVADTLTGVAYMNTESDTGTSNFIFGKEAYLKKVANGKVRFAVQTQDTWLIPGEPAPSYIQKVAPAPIFLFNELKTNEAVEALLSYDEGGGHYITVTGIDYQPTDAGGGAGKLTFVDPSHPTLPKGGPSSVDITLKDGLLSGVYKPFGTDESHAFTITFAEGESPTPEPGTWLLLAAGFCGLGAALRADRRTRARAKVALA